MPPLCVLLCLPLKTVLCVLLVAQVPEILITQQQLSMCYLKSPWDVLKSLYCWALQSFLEMCVCERQGLGANGDEVSVHLG